MWGTTADALEVTHDFHGWNILFIEWTNMDVMKEYIYFNDDRPTIYSQG